MFTGQNLLWNSYWTPLDHTGLVRISALSFGGNPLIHWVYAFPDTTPAGQCYTKRVKSKNRTWGFMKDCRGTHMKNSGHTKWHHRFHLSLAALHESFQLLDSAGLTKGFGSNTWSAMLSSQLDASLLPKKGDGLRQHQSALRKADWWRIPAQEGSSYHSLLLCPAAAITRRLTKHLGNAVMPKQASTELQKKITDWLPKILSGIFTPRPSRGRAENCLHSKAVQLVLESRLNWLAACRGTWSNVHPAALGDTSGNKQSQTRKSGDFQENSSCFPLLALVICSGFSLTVTFWTGNDNVTQIFCAPVPPVLVLVSKATPPEREQEFTDFSCPSQR